METVFTCQLSEQQAVALISALKRVDQSYVRELGEESKGHLSAAYHRLNGAVQRHLQRSVSGTDCRGLLG